MPHTGEQTFQAHCPGCDTPIDIPAVVETVLKTKEFSGSTIGLALSAKAIPHECDADQLTLDVETGEVLAG